VNIYCLFQTRNLFLPHCQDEEDPLYRRSGEKEGTGSYLHAYTHTTVQTSWKRSHVQVWCETSICLSILPGVWKTVRCCECKFCFRHFMKYQVFYVKYKSTQRIWKQDICSQVPPVAHAIGAPASPEKVWTFGDTARTRMHLLFSPFPRMYQWRRRRNYFQSRGKAVGCGELLFYFFPAAPRGLLVWHVCCPRHVSKIHIYIHT